MKFWHAIFFLILFLCWWFFHAFIKRFAKKLYDVVIARSWENNSNDTCFNFDCAIYNECCNWHFVLWWELLSFIINSIVINLFFLAKLPINSFFDDKIYHIIWKIYRRKNGDGCLPLYCKKKYLLLRNAILTQALVNITKYLIIAPRKPRQVKFGTGSLKSESIFIKIHTSSLQNLRKLSTILLGWFCEKKDRYNSL